MFRTNLMKEASGRRRGICDGLEKVAEGGERIGTK
jgi:hypothetical protein